MIAYNVINQLIHHVCYPDTYSAEENLIWAVEDVLSFMDMPLCELFHIVSANENIGLNGVCRQCKLPTDIEYTIRDYIGIWQGNQNTRNYLSE